MLEQLETDIKAGGVELAQARTHVAALRSSTTELKSKVSSKQAELKSIEAKISEETKMLTAFKDELDALDRAIKTKRQEIADGDLHVKECELEIERLKRENKAASDAVLKLERQYEWISDEYQWVSLFTLRSLIIWTNQFDYN